ncbi:MAG TPA: efflux transporter outer membrane subunit [Methylotenera sp.]|nr:efflux transporter outer membrane subunit [Methylotenera sp.]HPH04797.1 efflux transporter outer membrane subunit [Methylotenera sp.]HPN01580.1 efflux transporter outer membrane subunit [Methylotenera sp.]
MNQYLTKNANTPFKFKLTSFIIPVVLMTGCKSVSHDYQRPMIELPSQYTAQTQVSEANISKSWWTLYEDTVLNSLVEKSLKNNVDIKMAVARIEEAQAAEREIGAASLPQVDVSASANRSRVTEAGVAEDVINNPRNNFKAQLGTSFELDFWGKLQRAKESARAQALSTSYAKDTVALSLSGLVVNQYLVLRSLDSQIALSQENLKIRNESLALTQRRLDGGIASILDVHQAEVASANLAAQIAELTRQRSLSLHQLALLTGDLNLSIAAADIQTLPIPPVPPAGLPSRLLEMRPDIQQTEQQMIAANANFGVAKAALYPTISLTANLGGESLELGDILKSAARIWTGGLSLNLPIFDSGKRNARLDQASAKQKQALANYESAIQHAFVEVNDALINLRQLTERETALKVSEASAKKALEIAKNRYQAGYSAYLDVLDAQRVHNETALTFLQSRQARLSASVALFKALGGGWHPQTN